MLLYRFCRGLALRSVFVAILAFLSKGETKLVESNRRRGLLAELCGVLYYECIFSKISVLPHVYVDRVFMRRNIIFEKCAKNSCFF